MKKKIQILSAAALLTLGALFPVNVQAKELEEPVYAYGESLTDEQKKSTANLLNVTDGAKEMEVKINELNDLLQDTYDYYQVYSSVFVLPTEEKGIDVSIITPDTITSITENQYENAAITAGATSVKINVASVKAVDGSGALAGVYKAYKEAGNPLPEENIVVAQEELETTAKITEENKDKEGYDDETLNAAIVKIKETIQQQKESGTTINIGEIVNNVFNEYNLGDVITEEQKQTIINVMDNFKNIELTEEQKTALRDFGGKLVTEGGKLVDEVKNMTEGMDEETKSGIANFLGQLFESISRFFKNLFSGS